MESWSRVSSSQLSQAMPAAAGQRQRRRARGAGCRLARRGCGSKARPISSSTVDTTSTDNWVSARSGADRPTKVSDVTSPDHAHQHHRPKPLVVAQHQRQCGGQQQQPDATASGVAGSSSRVPGARGAALCPARPRPPPRHGGAQRPGHMALQRADFQPGGGGRPAEQAVDGWVNISRPVPRQTGVVQVQVEAALQQQVQRHAATRADGAHQQRQVEAVPDRQVVGAAAPCPAGPWRPRAPSGRR
jgi:hypothetical protein